MAQDSRHIDFMDEVDFPKEDTSAARESDVKTDPEGQVGHEEENLKRKVRVKELFDGTILVRENMIRQLPYLLFLTFLGILYIGNRFHAESMVRQIDELKIEVSNLRSEQITTTSELMNISRPSEVAALVESRGLGLKESMEPPKKLRK